MFNRECLYLEYRYGTENCSSNPIYEDLFNGNADAYNNVRTFTDIGTMVFSLGLGYTQMNKTPAQNLKDTARANAYNDSTAKTNGTKNAVEDSVDDTKNANPKTRLPRTNGEWEGEPGNGKWYSNKPEVNNITNGEGVEFVNGRPDFSPWSQGKFEFEPGTLNGTSSDFSKVYEAIKNEYGLSSQNQAKQFLRDAGLTPHHTSNTVIELIPTDLHKNIPHIGSASDMRGLY